MSSESILANLNPSQRAAVSSTAQTLAILAGPGSGKTHTLTSRTAWLLKHEGLQPWNIIVATFTVKAAREMKERIGKLIGDGLESKLILGTFHSIARRYLARYGHLIEIPRDFGIADSSDSLGIIKRIVKRHSLTIDPAAARSRISGRKAKGGDAQAVSSRRQSAAKSLEIQEFETCYTEYEDALRRSNLLDYDDLLLRCVDLLRSYPSCVSNVEAVLIDEFQDTNLVQFDLMRLFASQRKRVTIVGDPDQSIYGFRSAETKNFKRMLRQYPETVTIPLEENYRSSGAILLTALEVIQQDEGRISKSLLPTHNVGTRPVLRRLASSHDEAEWVVTEIKRCLVLTGNIMTFNDTAILLRSASLSRHIESALGKAGVPYRMVGGHRFFDRLEVKIILDYLRVINQPDNNDALARILNVPSRRIGETTVKSLLEEADRSSTTLWALVLENAQGTKNTKIKLAKLTEQGLSSFVNIILTARKKFLEPSGPELSVTDLIDHIIKKLSFEEFLQKSHPDDHEARWANVEELMNQASEFSDHAINAHEDDEALPEVDGLRQDDHSNLLSKFLANIALASDVRTAESSAPQPQITISTIHAAKGLEWPIVFIPAAYEGSIPHSRSEDTDEERRLLYVAMTRAKALLYMSCPLKNSQREQTTMSPFLSPRCLKPFLDEKGPSFTNSLLQSIATILNRSLPSSVNPESLPSVEDDLWPLNGEGINDSRNWEGLGGNPHYTQGQRPPKRQRIDNNENVMDKFRETWQHFPTTTMGQSATFSAQSVTIKSGFISAGSHLKVLNEKSVNCVEEKSAPSFAKSDRINVITTAGLVSHRKQSKVRASQNITSFFARPNSAKRPRNPQDQNNDLQRLAERDTKSDRKGFGERSSFMPTTPEVLGIVPSLATHRLGSSTLSAPPRPRLEEDGVAKKPYVCFSSSPPRSEQLIQDAEDIPANKLAQAHDGNCIGHIPKIQPAKTFHTTTMSHINTLTKKSLGVRRDVKGWANRKGNGQAFVVPSLSRRLGQQDAVIR